MSTLHQISGCTNGQRRADVIFIHGLGGDAFGTWRQTEGKSWPHWLGNDFPDVGVWSLGYASSPTKWLRLARLVGCGDRDSGHSMSLPDRASQVLDAALRLGIGQRPIFFICHSLGGLLAKQIMRKAADSAEAEADAAALWNNIAAVMFLGTPHSGAPLASLVQSFRIILAPTISMEELREHDAHLRDLNEWFRARVNGANVRVESYFESRDTAGARIVDPTTANCGVGKQPVPLDRDHLSIVKPENNDDQVCRAAQDILRTYVLSPNRGSGWRRDMGVTTLVPSAPEAVRKSPLELPLRAECFIGREAEVFRVACRLRERRNTAVVGPAGLGKTAVAAEALREVVGENPTSLAASPYPDGVVLLDLYKLRVDPHAFWTALANKVQGSAFMPRESSRLRAEEACRARHLLVVIEGAEEAHGEGERVSIRSLLEVLSAENHWLLLSRLRTQASASETIEISGPLEEVDAANLLDQLTSGRLNPQIRQRTLNLAGGHPLALTWASGLLVRGDDDPERLVGDWEREPLGELSDPTQTEHTLEWLFERSARELTEPEALALSAAGLLAYAPFGLAPMIQSQEVADEELTRDLLRGLINKGFLQRAGDDTWRFNHVLTYRFARKWRDHPILFERLQEWLMPELWRPGDQIIGTPNFARLLEHANAMVRADVNSTRCDRLVNVLQHVGATWFVSRGWPALTMLALSEIRPWTDRRPDEWICSRFEIFLAVADAFLKQGLINEAINAARDAERIARELVDDPTRRGSQFFSENDAREYLVKAKTCIGDVLFEADKIEESSKMYEEALALRRTVPTVNLDLSELLRKLAWTHRARDDWDAALEIHRETLLEIDEVMRQYPDHSYAPDSRFHCQMHIADVLVIKDEFAEALEILRVCLENVNQRTRQHPDDVDGFTSLSSALRTTGKALRSKGDLLGALTYQNDARELIERLIEKEPSYPFFLTLLSACHEERASILHELGNTSESLETQTRSVEVIRKVVSSDPTNASEQRALADRLQRLGEIQQEVGDNAGALASYSESLEITKNQPAPVQSTRSWRRRRIDALNSVVAIQLELNDAAAALATCRESLLITELCMKASPETPSWSFELGIGKGLLAEALEAVGESDAALVARHDSVDIMRRLVVRDPTNVAWQRRLAYALEHVGHALHDACPADALNPFRESLELSRKLAAEHLEEAVFQRDLGVDLQNVGKTLLALGEVPAAIATLEEALEVRRRLASPVEAKVRELEDLQRTLDALLEAHNASANEVSANRIAAERADIDARLVARGANA